MLGRVNPRELLIDTLDFLSPPSILEGLTAEQAETRPPGVPHSIAELVAHMTHWQEWFLQRTAGTPVPAAAHAAEGWPRVDPGSWPDWRQRFLSSLERAAQLTPDGPLQPPIEVPLLAHFAMPDVIVHISQHNAHHLGQVILLRQMKELWPPPSGGFTW